MALSLEGGFPETARLRKCPPEDGVVSDEVLEHGNNGNRSSASDDKKRRRPVAVANFLEKEKLSVSLPADTSSENLQFVSSLSSSSFRARSIRTRRRVSNDASTRARLEDTESESNRSAEVAAEEDISPLSSITIDGAFAEASNSRKGVGHRAGKREGGTTCHQCKRSARAVARCLKCKTRRYCGECISRWTFSHGRRLVVGALSRGLYIFRSSFRMPKRQHVSKNETSTRYETWHMPILAHRHVPIPLNALLMIPRQIGSVFDSAFLQ